MNQSSSHDLSTASFEIFDDSFDEPCSSPCALVSHSTPIKNSLYAAIPEGPDILIVQIQIPKLKSLTRARLLVSVNLWHYLIFLM